MLNREIIEPVLERSLQNISLRPIRYKYSAAFKSHLVVAERITAAILDSLSTQLSLSTAATRMTALGHKPRERGRDVTIETWLITAG